MLSDNRVLTIYIDFITNCFDELDQLSLREKAYLRNINIFNRKKIVEAIQHEYRQYSEKVSSEWGKIYVSQAHFSETMKRFDLLLEDKTLYAITLVQKFVEKVFYSMYLAIRSYTLFLEDRKKEKKYDWFLSESLDYKRTISVIESFFPVALEALKKYNNEITEDKKQAFIAVHQRQLKNVSIPYRCGDELTNNRIDQILTGLKQQQEKERARFEKGIKEGSIKMDPATYDTTSELRRALDFGACWILAHNIAGSSTLYDSLPELSLFSRDVEKELIVTIDAQARRGQPFSESIAEAEITSALYLGMVIGYLSLQSLPINIAQIEEKFLQKSIKSEDVPNIAMSFMQINYDPEETIKISKALSEVAHRFAIDAVYASRNRATGDELFKRVIVAVMVALKTGYHAYFRIKGILPGNTPEEDKMIFNQWLSDKSKKSNAVANETPVKRVINSTNNTNSSKTDIDKSLAPKEKKEKYWLASNGLVRCLNEDCPEECSLDCPIHLQTLALEYLSKNDAAQATRFLMKAVEIEPTFSEAWNNLAACYGQLGKHQEAYDAFKKSFDLRPKPNSVYGMAVALKNMKVYPMAMVYAKMYAEAYGSDNRITSLIAEISELQLAEKINSNQAD